MVGLAFFPAKMSRNDELEDTWTNFTPLLHVFEHQGKNCLWVVATSFVELGLRDENPKLNLACFCALSKNYVKTLFWKKMHPKANCLHK